MSNSAPRRSARLSTSRAQPQLEYPDSDSTAPSGLEASSSHLDNKRKRTAKEVSPTGAAHPSKKPRRGHSYPAKVVVDKAKKKASRSARPKPSLSSRYFGDGGGSEANSEEASLDPTLNTDSKPNPASNKSNAKAKGKARQIEPSSSEEGPGTEDEIPLSRRKSSSARQPALTTAKDHQSSEALSDVEAEMIRATIELSKQTAKPTAKESTSNPRSKSSAAAGSSHKKKNHLTIKATKSKDVEDDSDSEEDSDFEAELSDQDLSSGSSFTVSAKKSTVKKSTAKKPAAKESTAKESTSNSRQKGTGATSATPSRKRKGPSMISAINREDDEEESEFEAEIDDRSSIASSLSDAEDDDQPDDGTRQENTTSRTSRSRRRPRSKKTTWWEKNQVKLEYHHPELVGVWGDLSAAVKVVEPTKAEQPDGLDLTLLPFQLEGLDWMKKQEAGLWKGGILADEMGMGKTIQTIALILSDKLPDDRKQTLVIAPTVAIMQWRNEIEKFAKGLSVNVWHGGNRSSAQKEMQRFDVVLTSFAVLESAFRRQHSGFRRKGELIKEPSLLHKIHWHRVILDEAHNIKDRACNTAKGAFELVAKHKWCLSGTPLQNRVGELYSLIRFLGAEPFSFYFCKLCKCKSLHWSFSDRKSCDDCKHSPMQHVCFWNNEILKPIQKYGASVVGSHGHTAFNKLKVLLDRLMLRRTKLERADDLGLPPRAVVVRRDYFTEEEEELYSSLYSDVTRKFSTYADAGTVLNNYGNIFQLITRMRQMSNHPDLVLKSRAAQAAFKIGDDNAAAGASDEITSIHTCRLCLDEAEDAIISRCRHIFCRECIRQYLETATEQEPECPVCHLPITIDLSQDALESEGMGSKARQGVLDRLDPGKWRTSTKIEALVEELSKLNQADHTIKSLVFSQFTVFLDLIERRLQLAGFKLARLQGNMTPEARDRTIQYFMKNNDVQVFLVSLKAGGVALNLTEASRVFIMDPWWNPAVELQAMDRIHRLGQHRPVIVTRLIIENSIESRIVELQKKKEDMTGAALGDDDQALGRLTPQDLSFLFTL